MVAAVISDVRPGPEDLLKQLSIRHYELAARDGMSLSVWLEHQDPSSKYKDGLDAFERLLATADITTQGNPALGYGADLFEAFEQDEHTRLLAPEWMARQWRRVTRGQVNTRALFTADDNPPGSANNPFAYAAEPREQQIAPAIPLSEIVAQTTNIDRDTYKSVYIADQPAAQRMVRVGQGAEIPRTKVTEKDNVIKLHKYGRAIEVTYELLRRQTIDWVAKLIQRMAAQAEKDKVDAALAVLINGDGNSGTSARTVTLSSLDSAAAGNLTLKAWLAFIMQFENPYQLTTVLAQSASALAVMLLNAGSANLPLVTYAAQAGVMPVRRINMLADGTALGWLSSAPANKLVGFDRRFALERVTEIGSVISELERYVTRQTQVATMTENEGYDVLDQYATVVLDLAS
ncbi:MAG: phage major capsid protein [Thermomicrobiales bacterium]